MHETIRFCAAIAFGCIALAASAETMRELAPCGAVSLPHAAYGVLAPKGEGWECVAVVDKKTSRVVLVRWKKEGKTVLLAAWDSLPDPDWTPGKRMRLMSEVFLGDPEVLEKDQGIKGLNHVYRDGIKGTFFGRDGEKFGYYAYGAESGGTMRGQVFLYEKGVDDRYFDASCRGCSLQEFFAGLVAPAI
jgi:hypothetical protein